MNRNASQYGTSQLTRKSLSKICVKMNLIWEYKYHSRVPCL